MPSSFSLHDSTDIIASEVAQLFIQGVEYTTKYLSIE